MAYSGFVCSNCYEKGGNKTDVIDDFYDKLDTKETVLMRVWSIFLPFLVWKDCYCTTYLDEIETAFFKLYEIISDSK